MLLRFVVRISLVPEVLGMVIRYRQSPVAFAAGDLSLYNKVMSLTLIAQEDIPVAFFRLDGTSPYTDHTGRGKTATCSSTSYHAALVKDASRALVVSNTNKLTVNAPVYRQGFEHLPFSIEISVRSIKKDPSNTAPQQILGKAGQFDGLTIAGSILSFSTKYANTGEAKCSFDIQENRSLYVVAIHEHGRNALYVDGERVAEVEMTEAQKADTYFSNSTTLSSGETTGTNVLALNGLGLYRNVLADDAIFQHFTEAQENLAEAAVATAFGGAYLDLSPEMANPFYTQEYEDEEDWALGLMNGTTVENGQLVPQMRNGVSIAGTWEGVFALPQEETSIYGVTMSWEGSGATVATSVDGTTWVTATRGRKVATIPSGFNPVGRLLYIKASFPGGIANDESYLDDLNMQVYLTPTLPEFDGRTVTLSSAVCEYGTDVMEYHENYGLELLDGSLTISAGTTGSMLPKTIEVWAKKASALAFTDNLNATANTWYSDGGSQKVYAIDEWQLRTYIFNAGFTGSIVFSGTGQIGGVTIYPYAMTAAQVYASYKSYTGVPVVSTGVEDNIFVTDVPNSVDIYRYDWSITSAG